MKNQTNILILGPRATFGHQAAKKIAAMQGISAAYTFCDTNLSLCKRHAEGEGELGIVPIENNAAGIVPDWLTWCQQEKESKAEIIGEIIVDVHQCLMTKKETSLRGIKMVLSHERAIKQCSKILSKLGVEVREVSSTAEAASLVAESTPKEGLAAIASEVAAQEFDLQILESSAEDNPGNITRFGILRRKGLPGYKSLEQKTDTKRIIIKFDLLNKTGALHKVTSVLLEHNANMTSLRDLPQGLAFRYTYSFYMELEIAPEGARACIEALRMVTSSLLVFGNFFVTKREY